MALLSDSPFWIGKRQSRTFRYYREEYLRRTTPGTLTAKGKPFNMEAFLDEAWWSLQKTTSPVVPVSPLFHMRGTKLPTTDENELLDKIFSDTMKNAWWVVPVAVVVALIVGESFFSAIGVGLAALYTNFLVALVVSANCYLLSSTGEWEVRR